MAGRSSTRTVQAARQLGENLAAWRRLQNISAAQLADRAGVSRPTLSKLEHGDLGVGLGVIMAVLSALGRLDAIVAATDPYESDLGRIRSSETVPKRVRGVRA